MTSFSDGEINTQTGAKWKNVNEKGFLEYQLFLGTKANGDSDTGVVMNNNSWDVDFGYGSREEDSNLFRLSPRINTDREGFYGGTLERVEDETRGVLFGGFPLNKRLELEATVDTDRNAGLVGFLGFEDSYVGARLGRSELGDFTFEAARSSDRDLIDVRLSEDVPFKLRWVHGKVDPKFTKYLLSVDNSGNADLSRYQTPSIPFDISAGEGRIFDWYGVEDFFLGEDKGDVATQLQYTKERDISGRIGIRIGDVGFFRKTSLTLGASYGLDENPNGYDTELRLTIGNHLKIGVKASFDDEGNVDFAGYFGLHFKL